MAKKTNTNKAPSAIDAIMQPFSFESKSEQTHSEPKEVRLGGKVSTVSVSKKKRDEDGNTIFVWESLSRVEGGQVINASHRVRTGKTKRERSAKVRDVAVKEVAATKKKK